MTPRRILAARGGEEPGDRVAAEGRGATRGFSSFEEVALGTLGEDAIAGKAAAVSVSLGEGRVVMLGFRAQHRAQTHGTFKLVFNALMSGPPAHVAMATQEQGGGS